MSLLGFIAICVSVTGCVWLLQLIQKGSHRIDINVVIKPKPEKGPPPDSDRQKSTSDDSSSPDESDGVMGAVVSMLGQRPKPASPPPGVSSPTSGQPSTYPDAVVPPTQETGKEPAPTIPEPPAPARVQVPQEDGDYIDEALSDVSFEDHSNASLLYKIDTGQPPSGQVTFNCFGTVLESQPPDVFTAPQNSQQIESLFAAVQSVASRVDEQMKLLFELQQQLLSAQAAGAASPAAASERDDKSGTSATDDLAEDGLAEDGLSQDGLSEEDVYGGGLGSQLGMYPADESVSAPQTVLMSMSELGGEPIPEDAFSTHDLSAVREDYVEPSYEILPYFHCLNTTGELAHQVVDSVRTKKSRKLVKHHVRQVIRAIEHYGLNRDANLAVRLTAVLGQLPADIGEYDQDVAAIGRVLGMSAPLEEDDEPVEA